MKYFIILQSSCIIDNIFTISLHSINWMFLAFQNCFICVKQPRKLFLIFIASDVINSRCNLYRHYLHGLFLDFFRFPFVKPCNFMLDLIMIDIFQYVILKQMIVEVSLNVVVHRSLVSCLAHQTFIPVRLKT
jgi:hypothetical protein